jgi:hypothetical protein
MTTTERGDRRDLRVWEIKDVMSRVTPKDMTDAELAAAIAIFGLADGRLRARRPGGKPVMRIIPVEAVDGTS